MMILMDADGPDDQEFRTFAWCPNCKMLGLIAQGKWLDPRLLSDLEFFGKMQKGSKTVN